MYRTLICLSLFAASVFASGGWEYTGNTGPEHWGDHYEHCGGESQSPINIVRKNAEKRTWGPFVWIGMRGKLLDESRPSSLDIINNGHTVQVNLKGDYYVSGGGLPSAYKAVQFHYHWGNDSTRGSEHQLNGKRYAAEMHLVTYDFIRFKSFAEAVDKPRGLAVFGTFIAVEKDKDNKALNEVFDGVDEVEYNGEKYDFDTTFPIFPLMSGNKKVFYRYDGSLTTPPCYESVLWTVFDEPIKVSQKQINFFRAAMKTKVGDVEQHHGAAPETHHEPESSEEHHGMVDEHHGDPGAGAHGEVHHGGAEDAHHGGGHQDAHDGGHHEEAEDAHHDGGHHEEDHDAHHGGGHHRRRRSGKRGGGHGNPHAGGHDDGHGAPHAGGHDDGHGDPHAGSHDDGHGDPHAGGHDDGHGDPHAGGHDDGHGDPHAGGHDGSHGDPHAGGHDDGHGDPHAGGHDDGHGDPHAGGHGDGHGDPHAGGHDDGHGDPHAGGHGEMDQHGNMGHGAAGHGDGGHGTGNAGHGDEGHGNGGHGTADHDSGEDSHEAEKGADNKKIVNNFRPVQPLNGRKVFVSTVPKPAGAKKVSSSNGEGGASFVAPSLVVALITSIIALFAS